MAKWENIIMLKEFIQAYDRQEITIVELSKRVADYLRTFPITKEYRGDLDIIVEEFMVSETEERFNDSLEMLYDLGDTEIGVREGIIAHKLAWIETVF